MPINSNARVVSEDNPDEYIAIAIDQGLSPYRTPSPPVVYQEPFDWGPVKRVGNLVLIALPSSLILALISVIGAWDLVVAVVYGAGYLLVGLGLDIETSSYYGKMKSIPYHQRVAWWFLLIPFLMVKGIWQGLQRTAHYIKTGE